MNVPHIKALAAAVFAAALLAVIAACASRPAVIPPDTPPAKLIQRAQEASDRNKYTVSLQYYQALLERYGGDSDEYLCTAEYEIAFIHYKQRRYAEARSELEQLLARYNGEDAALLPPHFKILAEKVLSKIIEKGV